MDGTYFVGRKEILDWINSLCGLNLSKVEQTCTGAVACQILDAMYPGKVPMSKVDWSANKDYEYIANYKVLQKCFTNLKIDKHIEVDRLVRGKYQDNLEFMQWFKKFYELNASGQPYDPITQREKGKGGAAYTNKFGGPVGGGGSAPSPSPAAAAAKRRPVGTTASRSSTGSASSRSSSGAAKPASRTGTTGSSRTVGSGGSTQRRVGGAQAVAEAVPPPPAVNEKELEELNAVNEALTNENGDLRLAVEGLEKERDFYFGKLRDIEILLQSLEDAEANPLAQSIFKILYATEEEYVEGAEGVADAPQDMEM